MKLTGPQVKQLRDALISAFPTYEPLDEMVRIGLRFLLEKRARILQ